MSHLFGKKTKSSKEVYYISIILDRDNITCYDFCLHDSLLSRTYILDNDLYLNETTKSFFQKMNPSLFDYVLTLKIEKDEYLKYRKELWKVNSDRDLYINFCQNGAWKDLFKEKYPEMII